MRIFLMGSISIHYPYIMFTVHSNIFISLLSFCLLIQAVDKEAILTFLFINVNFKLLLVVLCIFALCISNSCS